MHTIEIRRATNGQYYVRAKARNGEVIATTETYTSKASAQNAAQLLRNGGGTIVDLT